MKNGFIEKETLPEIGKPVTLRIHVTSLANVIDRWEEKTAVFDGTNWLIDGKNLRINDWPIFNNPNAWSDSVNEDTGEPVWNKLTAERWHEYEGGK